MGKIVPKPRNVNAKMFHLKQFSLEEANEVFHVKQFQVQPADGMFHVKQSERWLSL